MISRGVHYPEVQSIWLRSVSTPTLKALRVECSDCHSKSLPADLKHPSHPSWWPVAGGRWPVSHGQDLGLRVPGDAFQISTIEAHDAMVKFGSMPQILVSQMKHRKTMGKWWLDGILWDLPSGND